MKWAICLVLCFIVGLMVTVEAQPCTTIKGIVVDKETSDALPGASIQLLNNQAVGISTDTHGLFELNVTNIDTLVVSFIGYEVQRIAFPPDCQMSVMLVPSQTSLNEVVIKSEKLIAEEFTIKKIRKLDIYTNPSAKADPLLAVNSTPSATTTDESANISLRGSSSAETGIFLNNVPINDAVRYSQLNGIGTFSIFNTALIENLQIYPGNPPLEFGNTTSGLIALQTEETIPSKPVNTLSVTMASLGFYTQQKLNEKSSITAFSNYQPSAVIKAFNAKALEDLERFNSVDLGVHYFRKLSDRTIVKVFTYGIRESYRFRYSQPTYDGSFIQEKWRNFTVANVRHRFKKSELSFNNGLSFSSANYRHSITNINLNLRDFYSSLNYQYFGGKAEFKTGLSYDYRGATFEGKYPLYDYAVGEQFPVDSSSSRESVKVPEGYFYLKYFFAPKWVAGVGVRKNIPVHTGNFLSGQVNLNYKPAKEWNINFSVGRYNKYQLPQGEGGDPLLIKSDQYSTDISYKKTKFESSLSVFYKQSQQRKVEYQVAGLEFYTRYRIRSNVRAQVSLTCLDAQQTSKGKTTPSQYDISYFLRGNIEYTIQGTWIINSVFLFRQGSFYQPVTNASFDGTLNVYNPTYGDSERLPAYHLIDISISKIFLIQKRYSTIAFAGLGNIINFKNVRGYAYNFDYSEKEDELFSQRTIYFGMIFNF